MARPEDMDPPKLLIPTALDIDRCPDSGHDRGYRCRVVREEVLGCGALVEDFTSRRWYRRPDTRTPKSLGRICRHQAEEWNLRDAQYSPRAGDARKP